MVDSEIQSTDIKNVKGMLDSGEGITEHREFVEL